MTTETNSKPSFLARLGRFLLRLLFVIIVGIALGVGIYYGMLLINRVYIQPVEDYAARLEALEAGQQQTEQLITQRFETMTERLDALEIQGDTTKESLSELDSRLAAVETDQEAQAAEINTVTAEVESMQTTLSELQTSQADMQATLGDFQDTVSGLEGLQSDFEQAQQDIQDINENIESLEMGLQEYVLGQGALRVDVELLKAMEQLTRSRIFLTQGNTSQAQAEIRAVASMLSGLAEVVPEGQAAYLEDAVTVLDESLAFLPRSPLQAADRLEGAWQMLLEGLPEELPEETAAEPAP